MHSIKHNRLEAAVLFAVQQQVHLAVSYSEMIARINTAPVKKSQSIRLEELIAAKEREMAKISRYKQSLYQDWKDGEITQQDYRDMKADYERQIIALTDVLARLNAERAELANGVKSEHPALVAFTKHQNIDQLSRELLVELIDYIKVYENGNISVRFKFADEFRRIAEYIEINTTNPVSYTHLDVYKRQRKRRAGFVSRQGVYESPRPSSYTGLLDKMSRTCGHTHEKADGFFSQN